MIDGFLKAFLSYYTLYSVIGLVIVGVTTVTYLGLWPVIIATLKTSAGRKAVLVAIGGFLIWIFSMFLYQKGKQAANDALKKNSQRLEDESNARREELKNLPPDKLADRAKPWLRD